jgi:hypothetical protein
MILMPGRAFLDESLLLGGGCCFLVGLDLASAFLPPSPAELLRVEAAALFLEAAARLESSVLGQQWHIKGCHFVED